METIEAETLRKGTRAFTFLTVTMMFSNVYVLPFLPTVKVGEAIFIILFPFFLGPKIKFKVSVWMFLFFIYSVSLTLIMALSTNSPLSNPVIRMVRDFVYIIIIFFLGKEYIDKKLLIKYIKIFCKFLSVYIIIQCVIFYTLHVYVPGIPYNLLTSDGGFTGKEIADTSLSYYRNAGYLKPPGFLCEASHCAQCILIGICVCLFTVDKNSTIDIKNAIFFSLAALLTMSAAAFVYVAVIWFFSLFASKGVPVKYKISIVIALFIGSAFMILSGMFEPIWERLSDISNLSAVSDNSTWLRLSRGFIIWKSDFNALQKIFGIGFGNIEGILGFENEYMNSMAYLLVSIGVLGVLLYCIMVSRLIGTRDNLKNAVIVAMIMMASCSSIYSSPIYVWGMLLLISSSASQMVVDRS